MPNCAKTHGVGYSPSFWQIQKKFDKPSKKCGIAQPFCEKPKGTIEVENAGRKRGRDFTIRILSGTEKKPRFKKASSEGEVHCPLKRG